VAFIRGAGQISDDQTRNSTLAAHKSMLYIFAISTHTHTQNMNQNEWNAELKSPTMKLRIVCNNIIIYKFYI